MGPGRLSSVLPGSPVETQFGPVGGTVYGGQQPIVGATVYAYQTSTSGYGGASTSLVAGGETTDAKGYFSFPASTTCTAGTVVYLYSLGGQPTTGVTNVSAGLMAVLGTCPSNGLLVNAVVAPPATSAQIYMNEVSTVAAAYALAGFATDATHIGAPTTSGGVVTDTLAQQGIQNAGANAAQMYTAVATSDGGGLNNGSTRVALATTPGGNGTVPQAEIDTIANILAACVNSASPFTACGTLFADVRSGGGSTGTKPTDTATAAIYLAQHPYSANVAAVFNLVGSTANPFNPALSTVPANFSVTLKFTASNLVVADGQPKGLAVDASGNVWTIGSSGSNMTGLNSLGVSIYLGDPEVTSALNSVAVDVDSTFLLSPSVVICEQGNSCWVNQYVLPPVSTVRSSSYVANLDEPTDCVFDGSNAGWCAGSLANALIKIKTYPNFDDGVLGSTAVGVNGLANPYALAMQPGPAGNIWVANNYFGPYGGNSYYTPESVNASVFSDSGAVVGEYSVGSLVSPASLAIDSYGNVWYSNSNNTVSKIVSTGASGNVYTLGTAAAYMNGIAIDGADNVWVADYGDQTVFELTNAGTNVSGSGGYAFSPATQADGLALDGSGNVWYTSDSVAAVYEIIGAAVPVVTPIAYGVANSLLGTRP